MTNGIVLSKPAESVIPPQVSGDADANPAPSTTGKRGRPPKPSSGR